MALCPQRQLIMSSPVVCGLPVPVTPTCHRRSGRMTQCGMCRTDACGDRSGTVQQRAITSHRPATILVNPNAASVTPVWPRGCGGRWAAGWHGEARSEHSSATRAPTSGRITRPLHRPRASAVSSLSRNSSSQCHWSFADRSPSQRSSRRDRRISQPSSLRSQTHAPVSHVQPCLREPCAAIGRPAVIAMGDQPRRTRFPPAATDTRPAAPSPICRCTVRPSLAREQRRR